VHGIIETIIAVVKTSKSQMDKCMVCGGLSFDYYSDDLHCCGEVRVLTLH
jgi:hypothetical protein